MVDTDDVRVLSFTRPWDELILLGLKPVENRVWTTGYVGALVVHAAKSWDHNAARLAEQILPTVLDPDECARVLARLRDRNAPTGHRGVVLLTHVCSAGQPSSLTDDPCGPWAFPGQYHWRVRAPHRLDPPIPGPGGLGLRRARPLVVASALTAIGDDPAYKHGRLL